MRSSWKVAVAACLVAVPQLAAADDVEEKLQQMQERMSQLEEKLSATTDQLEASEQRAQDQQKLIERAGLEERAALSGVASFFEQVEFGGWVTASYNYNMNNPGNGSNFSGGGFTAADGAPNLGTYGLANPFHPNTDTFQLDQLWFEMSKKPTEDSRAGFAADIVMGTTSDFLVGGGGDGNGNNVTVYQAYAEYLAPLGPGISIKGGRFATPTGAEVAQSVYNWNITRGLVYSILQPVNHVGVYASSEFDNGFSLGLGAANTALQNRNSDFDNDKAVIGHIAYTQDAWGMRLTTIWGGDNNNSILGQQAPPNGGVGTSDDSVLLIDGVLTWDPSENLSTWLDVTWQKLYHTGLGNDPWGVGAAVAGRLAITESTGFALRGEYLYLNDDFLFLNSVILTPPGAPAVGSPFADEQLWSLTGTLDHALTENLTAKAEVRYEQGISTGGSDDVFYFEGGQTPFTEDQVIVAGEVTYRF